MENKYLEINRVLIILFGLIHSFPLFLLHTTGPIWDKCIVKACIL